jgi:hypothetical protein
LKLAVFPHLTGLRERIIGPMEIIATHMEIRKTTKSPRSQTKGTRYGNSSSGITQQVKVGEEGPTEKIASIEQTLASQSLIIGIPCI